MSMQVARLCGLECEKSRAPRRQGARVPWRAAAGRAWSCLLGPAQLHCSLGHCSASWLVVFVHKSLRLVFSNVLLSQNKHFGGFIFAFSLFITLGISLAHI